MVQKTPSAECLSSLTNLGNSFTLPWRCSTQKSLFIHESVMTLEFHPYKCHRQVCDPTGQVYKQCQENNRRIHIHTFISPQTEEWSPRGTFTSKAIKRCRIFPELLTSPASLCVFVVYPAHISLLRRCVMIPVSSRVFA